MEAAILFFVCVGCVCALWRHMKDAELREKNPEVWIRKKEIEAGQKQRKHEVMKGGVQVGWWIARILMKR